VQLSGGCRVEGVSIAVQTLDRPPDLAKGGPEVQGLTGELFPCGFRIGPVPRQSGGPHASREERFAPLQDALAQAESVSQAPEQVDGLRAIVDPFEPRGDRWFLLEAKASTYRPGRWNPVIDWDFVFRVHVARAGTGVSSIKRWNDISSRKPRLYDLPIDPESVNPWVVYLESDLGVLRSSEVIVISDEGQALYAGSAFDEG